VSRQRGTNKKNIGIIFLNCQVLVAVFSHTYPALHLTNSLQVPIFGKNTNSNQLSKIIGRRDSRRDTQVEGADCDG